MPKTAERRSAAAKNPGATNTAESVRHDIEGSIHARTTAPGSWQRTVEDSTKGAAGVTWRFARSHPYLGTAAIGVGVLALGAELGVAELGLAAVAAYAAFQVLRGRESAAEAVRELVTDEQRSV